MKEYRIEIKVRNNIFLKKLEENGYTSIGQFCRINDLSSSNLGNYVNLKESPLCSDGQFKPALIKAASVLNVDPADLFSESQLHAQIKSNKRFMEVSEAELKYSLESMTNKCLEEVVDEENLSHDVEIVLESLTEKEKKIIKMRFGMDPYDRNHTFEDVSKEFNITRERARQIEAKALRKLRHISRSELLVSYIE